METLNDCNRIKISSEIPSIVSLQRVVRNLKLLEIYSRKIFIRKNPYHHGKVWVVGR